VPARARRLPPPAKMDITVPGPPQSILDDILLDQAVDGATVGAARTVGGAQGLEIPAVEGGRERDERQGIIGPGVFPEHEATRAELAVERRIIVPVLRPQRRGVGI